MTARLLAIGAVVAVIGIAAGDTALLHVPAIRNTSISLLAIIIPVILGLVALKIARTVLTIGLFVLVVLLGAGFVLVQTVLLEAPPVKNVVAVGSEAPKDPTLEAIRGNGQLVVVFFRGSW